MNQIDQLTLKTKLTINKKNELKLYKPKQIKPINSKKYKKEKSNKIEIIDGKHAKSKKTILFYKYQNNIILNFDRFV